MITLAAMGMCSGVVLAWSILGVRYILRAGLDSMCSSINEV